MADDGVKTAAPSGAAAGESESASALEGGSYDVIRQRLLDHCAGLAKKTEALNAQRTKTFGGSALALVATERIRTDHSCVPRDIRQVGGQMVFGYNVLIGLKTETVVADVFAVHQFVETAPGAFDLGELPIPPGHFLTDAAFLKEFTDLYRYTKGTRLLQVRTTDTRVIAVFQAGEKLSDQKVFRWGIDKGGAIKFIDARGEDDNRLARQFDFEWTAVTREDQISGDHPHYAIEDEVFVDTVGGDLTVKIENNTRDGRGVWREPVEDKNQSLDDAEVFYARLGSLILLRIKPYREETYRHLVFNTRTKTVVRIDAIGLSCLQLPEDQGIIFPGGYYLRTGDFKVFDAEISKDSVFDRVVKSPNGEDILYVYYREVDGHYLLLPYNLIRKEVQNPLPCHGYSLFDDGKIVLFKVLNDEPTTVHPVQIWQTPFVTQEHAAKAPTDGSYLSKVGNAELVRGISEAFTIVKVASVENPTRQTYEDAVQSARRMVDAYYWLGHAEAGDLLSVIQKVRETAALVIDEFEKVAAVKKRAAESLAESEAAQDRLVSGLRPEDHRTVDDFMGTLSALRKQRGHLITLREMRYMNTARIDELEKHIVESFDKVSKAAVEFLLHPESLKPLVGRLADVPTRVGAVAKATELKPIAEDVDKVNEGLGVLSDVIGGLSIEDPTQRTRILEGISEAYSQLNRARAVLQVRKKELSSAEGRQEFLAQFKLFGQSVVSAISVCDTPEKCDEQLSRLLLQLEELEGKFGEFDEFLGDLTQKREEVADAFAGKRQQLLDERQRRAQNILSAAERVIQGIVRKAHTLKTADDLASYFASDSMVLKLRDLAKQLMDMGESVKADELESKLKAARQESLRTLRDKTELFEDGDNVIKLGKHRFNVSTQAVELTLVPRRDDNTNKEVLFLHLTGTDFYEPLNEPRLEEARDLWDQALASEGPNVYRGEYLAAVILFAAEAGASGLTLEKLIEAHTRDGGLLEVVRAFSQDRHDEGYERGVHDHDAVLILEKLVGMQRAAGLLRFAPDPRALGGLLWSQLAEPDRIPLHRRCRSAARLRATLGVVTAQNEIAAELVPALTATAQQLGLSIPDGDVRIASLYLVVELGTERPRFVVSGSASTLQAALLSELDRAGSRRDFDEDLRTLEKLPGARLALVRSWIEALCTTKGDLAGHQHAVLEASALVATDRKVDRDVSTANVEATVSGLLGQHPRIKQQALHLRLDEMLARLDRWVHGHVPRFRAFRKLRQDVLDEHKKRLRLEEFKPRIMSSFVRNRLIDEVYLHLVGDNLAKQMGAAGATKRTDLMGLLLLISPPGYGKTTLMEYVANRLGLVFMKINGPALGHEVKSLDPAEAPNATARQEVEKINLALEMGNNVMLYLDDIQHTHSELLQKFISLCDAQRKIEGVWRGVTRTYDMRGKKFAVVMAGNPYTETGEKFRIPDMLANRADTYNLGDILDGKGDLFALSYVENALTSNRVLAPLSGRDPADLHKLIRMARGEPVPASELSYGYSAAEVQEIVAVLQHMFRVQETLLKVNMQYIASASQDDNYRTEPPFKLQGSYRNMNKITEKVVSAHTPVEVEALVDDHYAGESQTLTSGAENNLLKLYEMRGRMTPEKSERWEEIKKGYVRVKMMGGKQDDPVSRLTGTLAGLGEQLEGIRRGLLDAAKSSGDTAAQRAQAIAAALQKLEKTIASKETLIRVEQDPAVAELLAQQLATVESSLAPVVQALAESVRDTGAEKAAGQQVQAEALARAVADAGQQVQAQIARIGEVHTQQTAALKEVQTAAAQAREVVTATQNAAREQGQQLARLQQLGAQQAQHAAQIQQAAAQTRDVAARVAAAGAQMSQMGQAAAMQAGHGPAGPSVIHQQVVVAGDDDGGVPLPVQRPGMSAAESDAVARAQQALSRSKGKQGAAIAEVGSAVYRVEARLDELSKLIRDLGSRVQQGSGAGSGSRTDGMPRFDAVIDQVSASNFYRWKQGADVVREGGIFIATYRRAPDLGTKVALRVTLPGGVDFEATAVVEWTRPQGEQGPPWVQPGFGARFEILPAQAAPLVVQFLNGRQPMLFETK